MRYERVRIARELHDIIAYSLSVIVIVIQASVGQRLAADSPLETLDNIAAETYSVEAAIEGLDRLLDPASDFTPPSSPVLIPRSVTDAVPPQLAAVIERVVHEGLTNAAKYAPDATVTVRLTHADAITVVITNFAPSDRPRASVGTGHGLIGLGEMVRNAGGVVVRAGPTADAGWQLVAEVPADRKPHSHGARAAVRP